MRPPRSRLRSESTGCGIHRAPGMRRLASRTTSRAALTPADGHETGTHGGPKWLTRRFRLHARFAAFTIRTGTVGRMTKISQIKVGTLAYEPEIQWQQPGAKQVATFVR